MTSMGSIVIRGLTGDRGVSARVTESSADVDGRQGLRPDSPPCADQSEAPETWADPGRFVVSRQPTSVPWVECDGGWTAHHRQQRRTLAPRLDPVGAKVVWRVRLGLSAS
jgi:hypothetical protein